MGEFPPPPPPPPRPFFLNHADAQTSNTSTRLWFYYIMTKLHPPFQNPGSAPEEESIERCSEEELTTGYLLKAQV